MSELIFADWPALPHVRALVTTRRGGVSLAPYATNNLALHVGDDTQAVRQNRKRLAQAMPACNAIQWLDQVHGTVVHTVEKAGGPLRGDGLYTRVRGLACAVLTADCMPVFLTNRSGTEVAVVHAGWRGLAAGIIERAVRTFRAPATEIIAWLGPAISQSHFEVGEEVAQQLQESIKGVQDETQQLSVPSHGGDGKALIDLYQVARCQLRQIRVSAVFGGNFCTYADRECFYSYRRDEVTGRMASVIYLG